MEMKEEVSARKNLAQAVGATLFTNWHLMRWLRLAIGLYFGWQAVHRPDVLTGMIALFLLFQAVTNTGCCGASGCSIAPRNGQDRARADAIERARSSGMP